MFRKPLGDDLGLDLVCTVVALGALEADRRGERIGDVFGWDSTAGMDTLRRRRLRPWTPQLGDGRHGKRDPGDIGNAAPPRVRGGLEFDGLQEGSPRIDDLRRDLMRIRDKAAAMEGAKAGPGTSDGIGVYFGPQL